SVHTSPPPTTPTLFPYTTLFRSASVPRLALLRRPVWRGRGRRADQGSPCRLRFPAGSRERDRAQRSERAGGHYRRHANAALLTHLPRLSRKAIRSPGIAGDGGL